MLIDIHTCQSYYHVKDQGFRTTTFKLKVILEEGDAEESVLTARAQLMAQCFTAKASMTINKISYSCTFSECCLYCKVTGHEIDTCHLKCRQQNNSGWKK